MLQGKEARSLYLKGWADGLWSGEADRQLTCEALPLLLGDADALARLMECHAIHHALVDAATPEQLALWRDLYKVQWLEELVAAGRQATGPARLSTNLPEWLHTIADEDDRAEVELLARKVARGKLTEAEFAARVAELG
jgi:hypothetical protein